MKFYLIKISKNEAMELRARFKDLPIIVCNRQSSHKKYYVEESSKVIKYLKRINDNSKY